MVAVIAEACLLGVSTRRVDGLVQALGIEGISKSQVSQMAKSLDEQVTAFRNRPLDAGPYTYVCVDALT
jgi:putative transposase